MSDVLFLAWSSLRASPGRALVMGLGVAVAVMLPWATLRVAWEAEDALLARARATPIVVGLRGDTHDLVMSSVYFRGAAAEPIHQADVEALGRPGLSVVPLHLGHTAGGTPVVGTTLAYLDARRLTLASGRSPAVLGEVVAGAEVAASLGLTVGDRLRSDATDPYDVAGAFPLMLEVVGVLDATGGPDDEVLLADRKTTWVMDGLLHGHQAPGEGDVLSADDDLVVAAPSLFLHAEVTPETRGSFHLHGGPEDWPLSSALLFPADETAHDQALGRLAVDPRLQAARPEQVVRALLGIVLRVQRWLAGAMGLVVLTTLAFVATVVSLSLRLRAAEVALMRRLGASRARVRAILGAELGLVAAAGVLAAWGGVEVLMVVLRWRLGA